MPPVPFFVTSAHPLSRQILVQVKEVLAKLPTLVETTLKEVGAPRRVPAPPGASGGQGGDNTTREVPER